jgi:hypothetical protein
VQPSGPIAGQYIIVFNDDVTDPVGLAQAMARRNGISVGHVYKFALKGFAGHMSAAVADRLQRDPNVAYVEQNRHAIMHTSDVLPTGVNRIEADLHPGSASVDPGGNTINIAIMDSGIDREHPDLNVVHGVNCTVETIARRGPPFPTISCVSDGANNGDDPDLPGSVSHGTHVAGTVAAIDNDIGVVGVAPGFPLWAIQVFSPIDGGGTSATVIAGIDYVTQNWDAVGVVNMSLGFNGTVNSVCQAIAGSIDSGVIYVTSAGNSAIDAGTVTPSNCAGVIVVSSFTDYDGVPGGAEPVDCFPTSDPDQDDSFSWFSNYGDVVDIMAPGVCIWSTARIDDNDGYRFLSGTSMAAPHVTGAVALYLSEIGRDADGDGDIDGADVAKVEADLIANAIAQDDQYCGLTIFDDPDFITDAEPIVFGNAAIIGGDGSCGGSIANAAPAVTITAPIDGHTVDEGTSITITGTAIDDPDGDISSTLDWTSSRDGAIATNQASFSMSTLTVGTHTITASTTDSGSLVGSASIEVTVNGTANTAPAVTITAPTDGHTVTEGTEITFTGTAIDDPDGNISGTLDWASDGVTITTDRASFTTTLSVGTHTITASTTDNGGLLGSASIDVTVTSTAALSAATEYCGTGGRNSNKHLVSRVSVTDGINPVPLDTVVNATIIKDPGEPGEETRSGSGTVDANGEVEFSWKNAASDFYVTEVDSVGGSTNVSTTDSGVNWWSNAIPACN